MIISAISVATLLMGLDRLILGVHWFTDLLGSILLSMGLYFLFVFFNQRLHQNSYDRTKAR
jgi:membrane-associated phospholipid phosphatase